MINFCQPLIASSSIPQNESESEVSNEFGAMASSKLLKNDSETRFKVESEIPNVAPPSYKASTSIPAHGWKNLKLKVKTAKAFSNELATRNTRRYGYDPRDFQTS